MKVAEPPLITAFWNGLRIVPGAGAPTVTKPAMVCTSVPLWPAMMMGVVPKEVANDAVSVMPKRPLPVIDGGLKAAATPAGKPDADSTTVPANPWDTFTTIVSIAVPPGTMVTMAGEAETEKSGAPRIVRVVLAKLL
jgi:hypothetical protein